MSDGAFQRRTVLRPLAIGIPGLWLALFFGVPFLIVLAISFGETSVGVPPFTAPIGLDEDGALRVAINVGNYAILAGDGLYLDAYLNSIAFAGSTTLICLVLGYPMAYAIARARPGLREILLMLVILPFWTSFLIRVYAWIALLKPTGLVNHALLGLGLTSEPLPLLNNAFAVTLGLTYMYLPFMVLPVYATLEKMDLRLLEAAADLGARPWRTFLEITLPLSIPGMAAGSLLVFIPAVGEFVVPDLLGGPDTLMIGKVLWDEFFANRDWPVACALAVSLVVMLALPIGWLRRYLARVEAS